MSEMLQQLMAGAGAGGAGAAPAGDGGAAPGGAPAPPSSDPGSEAMELIRQALDLVRQYAQQENDEANTLDAEKITTLLQTILANEQKEMDDAMQGKASPRMLRNSYGG